MKKLGFCLFIIFVCFIFLFFECCKIKNKMINLQKTIENQQIINNRLVREIEEARDENKRYLDTCLTLMDTKWGDVIE